MVLYYILVMLSVYGKKGGFLTTMSNALLKHCKDLENKSITEMAEICYTYPTCVNRFFKKLGYHNFKIFENEFSSMMHEYEMWSFARNSTDNEEEDFNNYNNHFKDLISKTDELNDYKKYKSVCDAIQAKKKLVVIGSPISEGFLYLKMELEYQGIEVELHLFPQDQLTSLKNIELNSVLFIIDSNQMDSSLNQMISFIPHDESITIVSFSPNKDIISSKVDYIFEIPCSRMYENALISEYIIWKIVTLLKRRRTIKKIDVPDAPDAPDVIDETEA